MSAEPLDLEAVWERIRLSKGAATALASHARKRLALEDAPLLCLEVRRLRERIAQLEAEIEPLRGIRSANAEQTVKTLKSGVVTGCQAAAVYVDQCADYTRPTDGQMARFLDQMAAKVRELPANIEYRDLGNGKGPWRDLFPPCGGGTPNNISQGAKE